MAPVLHAIHCSTTMTGVVRLGRSHGLVRTHARTSPTLQVLGHAKTLLVLLGGWLLFGEEMNPRKVAGRAAYGCAGCMWREGTGWMP